MQGLDLGGLGLGSGLGLGVDLGGVDVWTKWKRIKGQLGIRSIPATAGSAMILLPIVTKSGVIEN